MVRNLNKSIVLNGQIFFFYLVILVSKFGVVFLYFQEKTNKAQLIYKSHVNAKLYYTDILVLLLYVHIK